MANVNEEYNKFLDADLKVLDEALAMIVNASSMKTIPKQNTSNANTIPIPQFKDKYKLAQEHQLTDGAAAAIVRSAESLLDLTKHLKQSILLNDFYSLNRRVRGKLSQMDEIKDKQNKVDALKKDLEEVVGDLEQSLNPYCFNGENIERILDLVVE